MFRRRLGLVLLCLAVTIFLQGVGAVQALMQAERKVVDGRVASDLHQGFVELSATKQRLRSWATQYMIGAGGEFAERDALYHALTKTLAHLSELAEDAIWRQQDAAMAVEHVARRDAIEVLGQSVAELGEALQLMRPLPLDARARQAWESLDELFEQSKGRDLRLVVTESIERERAAMQRERDAADRSLRFMHAFWLSISLTLAALALVATAYFNRALRHPIDALVAGAQALRVGKLDHRIVLQGHDEFAEVAAGMNAMAAALERHDRLQAEQREHLETQVRSRTAALREANASLHGTDMRRRQLLADISHELRTPTTAIRGEAEITLRGQDRPVAEYREALSRIVSISKQLGTVIDDLLRMARSDMETLTVVRRPVDLHDPLDDALSRCAALADRSHVLLGINPLRAGEIHVLGDAGRLAQLLSLLLDNAVRYSHAGGQVDIEALRVSDDGTQHVELRITDQGIGISEADLPLVFDRHFRGAAARAHSDSGSGLGLAIAQGLVQAHGGSLRITSPAREGASGGSCARLRLPLLSDEDAALWALEANGEFGSPN